MRKTVKKILTWIVVLTVVGTFLSDNVYNVMALEGIQEETSEISDAELYQADTAENTKEMSDLELIQTDQPDWTEENTETESDTADIKSLEEDSSDTDSPDVDSPDVDSPDVDSLDAESPDVESSNVNPDDGKKTDETLDESDFAGAETECFDEADRISDISEGEKDADNGSADTASENINADITEMENSDEEGSSAEETVAEIPGEEVSDADNIEIEDFTAEIPDAEIISAEPTYVLYITHTLLYTKNGKGMHTQETSRLQLSQDDFKSGSYDLMKQAYSWEAVTVSPGPGCPEYISVEDFWESGENEKEYHAEIRYRVKEGWEVRFHQKSSSGGAAFYSIYEGSFDDIEFVPVKSITLTIYYKYSNTGGLAGIDAHAPDVITLPVKEDGTADLVNWSVPHYKAGDADNANLQGFRTVLNPEPLNAFLVNPDAAKNPSAYPDALENGDFNLKPDVNINSQEYQRAWDEARKTTVDGIIFTYIAPKTNGGTAATTSDDPNKQYTLNASGLKEDLSLTIYYRRAMGSYKVKYWKVGANADGTDSEITTVDMPGRIGALTNAKGLDEASAGGYALDGYSLESIAQKTIAPDGSTVVDVYYSAGRIRVIFNTDYIYIPRQQVAVGGNVDFSGINESEMSAARPGYTFKGWQYENKSGNREDITLENSKLRLTDTFLAGANIAGSQETDEAGIRVLNLYPKWEEASTTVRVTFWTEDLNGKDVKVEDVFYDFTEGKDRPVMREGYKEIVHEDYNRNGAAYTNVGSFTVDVRTGTVLADRDGKPTEGIQNVIDSNLSRMGKLTWNSGSREASISDFYEQQNVAILDGGTENRFTAAADGSTQIYVFFQRREYTLDFVYYFLPEQTGINDPQICTNTNNFSNKDWPQENENCPNVKDINASMTNVPLNTGNNQTLLETKIPRRTAVTAKYGANLRDVWPGAEAIDSPDSTRYLLNNGGNLRISWATTKGIHHDIKPGGNVNVPGAYSTMSAEIVADTGDNSMIHHLVAFWSGTTNNTYRYNYCYEVPDLNASEVMNESPQINILYGSPDLQYDGLSDAEKEKRNTLYLVPVTEQAFLRYGFSDLLTYDELALTDKGKNISGDLKDGVKYYVIRVYRDRCYAVSRQLVAIAALEINSQNPSARPNLTLVNSKPDRSTQIFSGGVGDYENASGKKYNTPDNPYDIYFYYARDEFTITYMSNATTEIGKITLPYGASLYGDRYNIPLDHMKKAGYYATERNGYAAWSTMVNTNGTNVNSEDFPVCPGRAEDGTRAWEFEGWTLEPSGERPMEWEYDARTPVTIGGNLRLYADWKAPAYTVEFDWNGGEFSEADNGKLLKTQKIQANQSFVKGGRIPRPVREGYILEGWQITHTGRVNGDSIQWISAEGADGVFPEFHFDQPVTSDLKVQAVWTPSGVAEITYTVSYLEEKTKNPVADPKTVTGSYRAGTVIWERPAVPKDGPYRDYVPLEQNKSITLDTVKENRLVFYYTAPSEYPYTVRFVEKGTDDEILKYEYATQKVSLMVCPEKEQVRELDRRGYQVIDDNGDPAEDGTKLGRIIQPGVEDKPEVAFYVLPREYEIRYTNLEVMGDKAEELRAKNPSSYTRNDPARTIKNPEESYIFNGMEYRFLGWRLEKTGEVGTVEGETPDFGDSEIARTVTIQPGSRGRLVFQAVWAPDNYVVYFYPGSSGVFQNHEPFIHFGGLAAGTPLAGNVTVPAVTPDGEDEFIGWWWEEGEDRTRLYTEAEILAMSIEHQDLHFTARYQSDPKDEPDSDPDDKLNSDSNDDPQKKDPDNSENSSKENNSGGPDNRTGTDPKNDSDRNNSEDPGTDPEMSQNSADNTKLPQTGVLWWPVWLLAAAGFVMIGIGAVRRKGSRGKS